MLQQYCCNSCNSIALLTSGGESDTAPLQGLPYTLKEVPGTCLALLLPLTEKVF